MHFRCIYSCLAQQNQMYFGTNSNFFDIRVSYLLYLGNVRYKGNSMATLNCQTSITERIPNSGFLLFFRNAFGKVNSWYYRRTYIYKAGFRFFGCYGNNYGCIFMIKALKNYQTEFTESKMYNCRREAKCSLPFDYCI